MSPSDLRHVLDELARDADTHHPVDRLARVHQRARRTARTRAVAGAAAAVVVVLGGTWALHAAWTPEALGPGSPTTTNQPTKPQPTPTQAPTPVKTPIPTPTPTPGATKSGPTPVDTTCRATNLSLQLGTPEGTAGSMYVPVVLTNTGSVACRIAGYPTVTLSATSGGPGIGAIAAHDAGYPVTAVKLAPGAKASGLVRIVDAMNVPASSCGPVPASFLRVTVPGSSTPSYLALPSQTTACSKPYAQLFVRPVLAGTTGTAS